MQIPFVTTGKLSNIYTSSSRRGPMMPWEIRQVLAGKGIYGDRYTQGKGSYQSNGSGDRCVSLMDARMVRLLGWKPEWTRRNLFVEPTNKSREPFDLTCAHDLALNPDRVLRMHLPDDDRRENIMIGHAVFEITGYCTPCMVPNVMRKEAEPGFTGSFMYDFAGIGGLLLKPLNNETIKVGDSFRQISRGY